MQFSLLNFLIGLPQLNALANAAQNSGSDTNPKSSEANLFSELLADQDVTSGDLQQDQSQSGGDLSQELVSNLTVAQDATEVLPSDDDKVYLANIQGILNRKLSPERAHDLLKQFDANTSGERPPEALKEILEAVEAGGEPVAVQEILSQLSDIEVDAAPEQRANTLQRALQWLQQTLTPNTAPMEALAFANAAAMFPEDKTITHASSGKRKEKDYPEGSEEIAVMIPRWVQQISNVETAPEASGPVEKVIFTPAAHQHVEVLPEVELPTAVNTAQAAPVDDSITVTDTTALTEEELVLVATRHNNAAHAQPHTKSSVFDALISDLAVKEDHAAIPNDSSATPVETDASIQAPTHTSQTQQAATDTRSNENVRIHHAHFAYLRSEVMDQVKVGVTQAVRDGVDRITVQLNPAELGRVEVKMDIVADGMSQVSFLVDKQETFDLLQRDARTLERMLQDAGVRADAGSMQFNLRQDSQSKEPWGEAKNGTAADDNEDHVSTLSTRDLPTSTYLHLVSDRIDIRA